MKGVLSRLIFVAALHAGLFYLIMQINPAFKEQHAPLVVSLITPPQPLPQTPSPPPPPSKPRDKHVIQLAAPPVPVAPLPAEPAPNAITIEAPPPSPASPKPHEPATEAVKASPPPVVPPRFDAAYLNNPAPVYPVAARRRGEEGRVYLRVYVSIAGSVLRVEVRTSSGSPSLDQAAKDAVEHWRFVPARQGDQAVDAWVIVPIVFTLKG